MRVPRREQVVLTRQWGETLEDTGVHVHAMHRLRPFVYLFGAGPENDVVASGLWDDAAALAGGRATA
jgi:hypothetical protein